MEQLIFQIIVGIIGFFLAQQFVPGVEIQVIPVGSDFLGIQLTQPWQILALLGFILGLINFFIKPILGKITFPLKLLTFGLSSLIINMAIIWFLDVSFLELQISGLIPLFWTTIIIWLINFFLGFRK